MISSILVRADDQEAALMRVRRESGTRRLEYEIPRFKFTSETVGRMSEKALDFSDETGCGAAQDDLAVVKRSALLKSRD